MPKSITESWSVLESGGVDVGRTKDGSPYVPPHMPSYDDGDPLSTMFFRGEWRDIDFGGLSLPRTYFAKSLLDRVRFTGSDLSESRMCWNDFVQCDFTGANLRGCDLRASIFRQCDFRDADLSGVDMRMATFEACNFQGAKLNSATADKQVARKGLRACMNLTQRLRVNWVAEPGAEPPGG